MLNPFEAALTRRHVQLAEANLFHWGATAPGLRQAPAQDSVASARRNGKSNCLRAGGNAARFFPSRFLQLRCPPAGGLRIRYFSLRFWGALVGVASARWNGELHRLRAGGNAAVFFPSRYIRLRPPPAGE